MNVRKWKASRRKEKLIKVEVMNGRKRKKEVMNEKGKKEERMEIDKHK